MNSSDLIKKFGLPFNEFTNIIIWDAGDVGFSIFEDRDDGYASLYKIGIAPETGQNDTRKLWVTASYGKKTNGGLSIGVSDNINRPVDLEFFDEFSFNSKLDKFFYFNKEIDPKNILIKLKRTHLRPTKLIIGLPLRIRLFFWRKFLPTTIKIIDKILSILLLIFTGETIKKDDRDVFNRLVNSWHEENNKKPNINLNRDKNIFKKRGIDTPETWNFIGFTSTKWSVVFYSILNILFYILNSLFWEINNSIIKGIFNNGFLIVCYVAISFIIVESFIPNIIKILIEKIPKLYKSVIFRRLKVMVW